MKSVTLFADWDPRPNFTLGSKDIEGKLTYLGSKVWRNPEVKVMEKEVPEPGPTEVLIRVRACGICGSDVHMFQADGDGYILYPGLTAFPATLGHEFSGEVEAAGSQALNKRTGKPFQKGEAVTAEEMFWCASCRPCADGYPNHCEALQELGFSTDGAFAEFVKIDSRYVWSIEPLRSLYKGEDLFTAGSLVEPTSVAYNAVIERGGGIRAGDNVVILGGGPIGLAACAILRRSGAASVILSEPSKERAELGMKMGATHVVNPFEKDPAERILSITEGQGAKLYLEATGLPDKVWGDIERVIWQIVRADSTDIEFFTMADVGPGGLEEDDTAGDGVFSSDKFPLAGQEYTFYRYDLRILAFDRLVQAADPLERKVILVPHDASPPGSPGLGGTTGRSPVPFEIQGLASRTAPRGRVR